VTNLSFHLFQLQKIDQRLDQVGTRVKQINDLVSKNQALEELDRKVKQAEADTAKMNQEIADLAAAARAKTIKIEQSESSLYKGTIQNPKELGDLQKEIASLKSSLKVLEDEQFKKLLESDSLDENLKTLKNEHKLVFDGWQESNQTLLVELDALNKEKEKLLVEHKAVVGQIPADQLLLYENLRNSKNRIAVTTIEDESCTICGSEISAANIQKAKSASGLITCPSCGRIIYSG
jgi:predicted  nucleic acid-binding Zn-ribbon protein